MYFSSSVVLDIHYEKGEQKGTKERLRERERLLLVSVICFRNPLQLVCYEKLPILPIDTLSICQYIYVMPFNVCLSLTMYESIPLYNVVAHHVTISYCRVVCSACYIFVIFLILFQSRNIYQYSY